MMLIQMSIQAGMVIAVGAALRGLSKNRLPRFVCLLFWVVALARMLIPFQLPWGWGFFEFPQLPQAGEPGEGAGSALAGIWLLTAVMLALFFFLRSVWMVWALRSTAPVEETDEISRWRQRRKRRERIAIQQSYRISSPMAAGIFRPRILLPAGGEIPQEQMKYILTHEDIHLARRDALWKGLAILAACLHWFNPLAWVLLSLLNRDLELACDERVLRELGWDRRERKGYAYSLIAMAEQRRRRLSLETHFSKHPLEERIEALMRVKRRKKGEAICWLALSAVITMLCLSGPVAEAAAPVENPESGFFQTAQDAWENSAYSRLEKIHNAVLAADFQREEYFRARLEHLMQIIKEA